jgi:hypothetical protein
VKPTTAKTIYLTEADLSEICFVDDAKKVARAAFDKLRKRGSISFADLMAKTAILSNTPKGRNENAKPEFTMEKRKASSIEMRCKFDPFNIFYIVR